MVLSLTIITLFAAAALGGVYTLTKEPIEQAKIQKQTASIAKVLPAYSTLSEAEPQNGLVLHKAYDEQGELVGAAVETAENGFGGVFKLMVGFDRNGNIVSYEVLEQQETPGLGSHITEWFKTDKNNQSICGKSAREPLGVTKDGGEVDAITAATISSRAFLLAVNNAYNAFAANITDELTDAASGASRLVAADSIAAVADSTIVNEIETTTPISSDNNSISSDNNE